MMLKKAMDSLGDEARNGDITTAMILKGLGNIKDETLDGLIAPTTFKAGGPQAMVDCYFPVKFGNDGKWTAPLGDKFQCLKA